MAYVIDGDIYCDDCATDATDDQRAIGGESDSPQHCGNCHCPLFEDFGLTSDGVKCVLDSVREQLRRGTRTPRQRAYDGSMVWTDGYYVGLPWLAVTRDWAEWLLDSCGWSLARSDRRTLELFMHWTRYYAY